MHWNESFRWGQGSIASKESLRKSPAHICRRLWKKLPIILGERINFGIKIVFTLKFKYVKSVISVATDYVQSRCPLMGCMRCRKINDFITVTALKDHRNASIEYGHKVVVKIIAFQISTKLSEITRKVAVSSFFWV